MSSNSSIRWHRMWLCLSVTLIHLSIGHPQEFERPVVPRGRQVDLLRQPSDRFGFLLIKTNIDSFYVIVDGDFSNCRMVSKLDTLKLSVASPIVEGLPTLNRNITIASRYTRDHNFDVEIVENEIIRYRVTFNTRITSPDIQFKHSSYPRIYHKANLMVVTDNDSEIFINGKWMGLGGVKIDTLAGSYIVETRHKHAGKSKKKIQVRSNRLAPVSMYNKPKKALATVMAIVPGWNQFYKNQKIKGAVFFGVTATSFGLAYFYERKFQSETKRHLDLLANYQLAYTEEEAFRLGEQLDQSFDTAEKAAAMRDIFLYTGIGIYVLNMFDVIIKGPKGGYRRETNLGSSYRFQPAIQNNAVGLRFEFNF